MSRWLVVLALVFATAPAAVQAQSAPAASSRATGTAQAEATRLERAVATAIAARNALNGQYQTQLKSVDRLKQQRASWRRDRELKDAMSTAQATASKLSAAASELGRVTAQLTAARRTLLVAIDRELGASPSPSGARASELNRQKQRLAPARPRSVAKIVLPDMQIDPLADPEELDAQAAELRRAEQELERQAIGLDTQAKQLDERAKLLRAHERAGTLANRDDDQPQRTARVSSGGRSFEGASSADDSPQSPAPGDDSGGGDPETGGVGDSGGNGAGGPSLADTSVVLSNVVDATTIETLSRASRSGDPTLRAQAAKQTSNAVKQRLEQLRKKRAEIEAAAKSRRR